MNDFIYQLMLSGVASDEAVDHSSERSPVPPSLYASATWGLSPRPVPAVCQSARPAHLSIPLLPSYSKCHEPS